MSVERTWQHMVGSSRRSESTAPSCRTPSLRWRSSGMLWVSSRLLWEHHRAMAPWDLLLRGMSSDVAGGRPYGVVVSGLVVCTGRFGNDLPSGKRELASTTPMRLDIGVYIFVSVTQVGNYPRVRCLTAGDVSLEMLLAGEALPAVCAEDHDVQGRRQSARRGMSRLLWSATAPLTGANVELVGNDKLP